MVEFDRIVPVVNPYCSNVERASGYLEDLRTFYPDRYDRQSLVLTTSDRKETTELITEGTRDGDLMAVLGGDGTIGVAAEAIVGRQITALLLWAGNGNDSARDLNGEAESLSVTELIRNGKAAAIHPGELTIDSLKRQFVNYFGVGSTGKGARTLNSRRWRNLPGYDNDHVRNGYEWLALPAVGVTTPRFTVEEAGRDTRSLVELTVAHAAYMAKYARPPVRLTEPRAFITEATNQLGLLPWAIRGVRGTSRGEYLEQGQVRSMRIGRTVLAHTDAEPFVVERGSQLTLAIADTPFYAVSIRP